MLAVRRQKEAVRSSRPAWSTEQVPEQPGIHREKLSQKTNKNSKGQKDFPVNHWFLEWCHWTSTQCWSESSVSQTLQQIRCRLSINPCGKTAPYWPLNNSDSNRFVVEIIRCCCQGPSGTEKRPQSQKDIVKLPVHFIKDVVFCTIFLDSSTSFQPTE